MIAVLAAFTPSPLVTVNVMPELIVNAGEFLVPNTIDLTVVLPARVGCEAPV